MRLVYILIGALAGLVLARVPAYIDKWIEQYANHSLPPEYTGPKYSLNGKWVDSL